MKLVMLDNYDSFTYNIVQYLQMLGAEVQTFRGNPPKPGSSRISSGRAPERRSRCSASASATRQSAKSSA